MSFGIKTVPQSDARYDDIRRLWREADEEPAIEHAWLWDHLQPPGLPFPVGTAGRLAAEVIGPLQSGPPA